LASAPTKTTKSCAATSSTRKSAKSEPLITRVFRAIHLPHRRREAENDVDGAPKNVQPGELIYDEEYNKLYAGLDDVVGG
jgi:hypothetical protein